MASTRVTARSSSRSATDEERPFRGPGRRVEAVLGVLARQLVGSVEALDDLERLSGRASDVVAAEDLADGRVLEDGVEGVGDDRGDRQHGQALELLLAR